MFYAYYCIILKHGSLRRIAVHYVIHHVQYCSTQRVLVGRIAVACCSPRGREAALMVCESVVVYGWQLLTAPSATPQHSPIRRAPYAACCCLVPFQRPCLRHLVQGAQYQHNTSTTSSSCSLLSIYYSHSLPLSIYIKRSLSTRITRHISLSYNRVNNTRIDIIASYIKLVVYRKVYNKTHLLVSIWLMINKLQPTYNSDSEEPVEN